MASVGPSARPSARTVDLAVLLGLLALAAVLRLPDLATRGIFDADQGTEMLALRALVRDGVVPLLGPPTSIGDFHHGALYYYLLAPAAWLTGGDDPTAVVLVIALAGVAGVGLCWWLARAIAGSGAGFVAGLAAAISATGIEGSTFIWNPNLVAPASALALAASWQAWRSRRPAWWLLAAVGVTIAVQCHVLAVALVPIAGALLLADAGRSTGAARRAIGLAALGAIGVVAIGYLPLFVHELGSEASELRALVAYLTGTGSGAADAGVGIVQRLVVIPWRVVAWPLTGLVTDAPLAALLALAAVVAIVAWRWRSPVHEERVAVRWLGLGLAWTGAFLAIASPSLATVVPGLPNDQYHAFADPMVVVLLGIGAAAASRPIRDRAWGGSGAALAGVAVLGVVALVAWNVAHLPPAAAPDGGFPAAAAAADRVIAAAGPAPIALRSLPAVKAPDALRYPLTRAGRAPVEETAAAEADGGLALLCDARFETLIGAPCGGPAEVASLASRPFGPPTAGVLDAVDRFTAAPDRWISVYRAP